MAGDYVAGSLALVLIIGPWLAGAPRLARRLLPEWRGSALALAAAVLGVSGVLVVSELCGIVGGFSRWTVVIANLVAGLAAAAFGRGPAGDRHRPSLPAGTTQRIALGAAVVCLLAVTAAFLARDARGLQTGPSDDDSLHYHLSTAAYFVQTHSVDHLHHLAASDNSVYYPFDGELLQAAAMLGPRPDLGVFGLNLLFGWLALLACWVIGARWSVAEAATAAGAAMLCLPVVAAGSSGPGLTDVPSVAAFLAGIAMLLQAGLPRGDQPRSRWLTAVGLGALALGVAAGSKVSTLAPVVLVAVALLVAVRGDRWRFAATMAGGAFVTGGFWYVRDWIEGGTPVPGITLAVGGHGFHAAPVPEIKADDFSVAHYASNGHVIRHWFIPGLHAAWSFAWPLIVVLVIAGVVAAVRFSTDRVRKLLAVAVVAGVGFYAVTPTTAFGAPGQPVLFAANTRYLLPVLSLALVLLAVAEPLRKRVHLVTVGLAVLCVVLLADQPADLAAGVAWKRGAAVTIVLAGVVLAGWYATRRRAALPWSAIGVLAVVVVVAIGAPVQHRYLRDRYNPTRGPLDQLFAFGKAVSHANIGVVGYPLQYPFYGPSLSNRVTYAGVTLPDGGYGAPRTCQTWQAYLAKSGFDYLVIEPATAEQTGSLTTWTLDLPGTRPLGQTTAGQVIALPATITPTGC